MAKKRILVIDDEEQIIKALVRKLEQGGFEVLTAADGKEGLQKALSEKPDLILLDLILPYLDGISLLDRIKNDARGKKIPVLVLSNLDDANKVKESRRQGISDYLVKTAWTLDEILEKVKNTLSVS